MPNITDSSTVDAIASRLQGMVITTTNMAIWLRAKAAAKQAMVRGRSLATYRMSVEYRKWYPKAVTLINKLLLPENADYWRSALPYERSTAEYHNWRINCLNRDNWQCQGGSNEHAKQLYVHHIKSYKGHKELRLDIDNGITLCKNCHKVAHKRAKHAE